jgi:hypothetical protein
MTGNFGHRFVDGSNVDVRCIADERRVELEVDDDDERQRYLLTFLNCSRIEFRFSEIDDPEESDLWNLTEGVYEQSSEEAGVRSFIVGFTDDSELRISCEEFNISTIEGYGAAYAE